MRFFALFLWVAACLCTLAGRAQNPVLQAADSALRKAAVSRQVKQLDEALAKKLGAVKKPSFTYNMSVEEALRYQPSPLQPNVTNNIYLKGTVQAFGIPMNVNFSNDHLAGINNDLFKFDFNPAQFAGMFKSDLQQYYELRKNAFGGLDMGSYVRNAVQQQLKAQESGLSGKLSSSVLSQYLGDPAKVTALMGMSEEQIRQKLTAVARAEAAKQMNTANPLQPLESAAQKKIAAEQQALQQYLSQPANLKALQGLSEQQVVQRLSAFGTSSAPVDYSIYNIAPGLDIGGYVRRIMAEHSIAHDEAVKQIARQLVTTQRTGKPGLPVDADAVNKEVNTIAQTIAGMKSTLAAQGVDLNKMLQIQQLMDQHGGTLPATEAAARLLSPKPAGGLQNLFTKIQAFKLGAFANEVPGNTLGQDMFLQGTHVTFKLNNIPITAGYSNSNDIAAAKDAPYQSSVYSSPKTITYLGAKISRGVFGSVKISVASSFGTGVNNNTYRTTSSASDNVAITMSKEMKMGRLGDFTLDVSKSTTLYNNNYQVGSDVLLAQKAGINLSANNDLFEAVGVGLAHHLDIQEAGFSDNVYYNYAGMGYQNPGNNGFGGARTKLGGSIRKSFYKNKLILNLRTDLRNTPISYTTNDQWKNYQVQLDSRYNVSKKFNMSFKYTANGTDKLVDNVSTPVYSFQKIQVDGNLNYKIGKNFSVSHFSIGKQDFTDSYMSASGGSMILVNYTQSMVFNRNTLTANILYNKEMSALQLLGNLLNSDVSYSYQLFQKVNMSSGLTYLNNTGIASQAGIRQSIQLMANGHFDLGSYIDIRKNLVTPLYPDLYAACRAELSFKYHFKN